VPHEQLADCEVELDGYSERRNVRQQRAGAHVGKQRQQQNLQAERDRAHDPETDGTRGVGAGEPRYALDSVTVRAGWHATR
jgi:hypothetical protein